MSELRQPTRELPPAIEESLRRFCETLTKALGERLVSIVLYGGLAKGEDVAESSDVNLLVIVREVDLTVLDLMAPVVEQGRREFGLALLLLAESDLAHATELFSTKFFDLQRHHRVLRGAALKLEVDQERLRRQCLRELVNVQWRLRKRYLEQGQKHPDVLEVALRNTLSPFLTVLAVLVELKTGRPIDTKAGAAGAAAELGLNRPLLERLLAWKSGQGQLPAAELKQVFWEFLQLVSRAARTAETA